MEWVSKWGVVKPVLRNGVRFVSKLNFSKYFPYNPFYIGREAWTVTESRLQKLIGRIREDFPRSYLDSDDNRGLQTVQHSDIQTCKVGWWTGCYTEWAKSRYTVLVTVIIYCVLYTYFWPTLYNTHACKVVEVRIHNLVVSIHVW